MNRVIWGFVCVCICLLRTQVGIAAESEQSQPREKYALLVGVTRYKVAELNQLHLEYPETDAQAIGEVLRKSGYKVDLLLGKDANQQAIRAKLKAFTEQGTEQGVALVGLFGLGCQVASVKADYFCPFDTTVKSENKQPATATPNQTEKKSRAEDPGSLVSLSEVLDALKSSPAGNRVLLADCRLKELPGKQAQPFASGLRARCREERIAMFVSCAAGQHAIEKKDQGHGKFSKCLLDEFTDSSVTGDANAALLAATLQKQLIKLIADSAPGDIQTLTLFGPESVDLQLCSDSDFARGIALFWRFGTDDDAALALELLVKSAKTKHPLAMALVAKIYQSGYMVRARPITADELAGAALPQLRTLAAKGHRRAQLMLGEFYKLGLAVPLDNEIAIQWYRKAAAQNQPNAQYQLGHIYDFGIGVPADSAEAIQWYTKAANQDHSIANLVLGGMYGAGRGVPEDLPQALRYYQKAAELNFADAQHQLGSHFFHGIGTEEDFAAAAKWYRKAAEQNHPEAQCDLAAMYEKGMGVAADPAEAFKWYRRAALQNVAVAQKQLVIRYIDGTGVKKDFAEAVGWYRKLLVNRQSSEESRQEAKEKLKEVGVSLD